MLNMVLAASLYYHVCLHVLCHSLVCKKNRDMANCFRTGKKLRLMAHQFVEKKKTATRLDRWKFYKVPSHTKNLKNKNNFFAPSEILCFKKTLILGHLILDKYSITWIWEF